MNIYIGITPKIQFNRSGKTTADVEFRHSTGNVLDSDGKCGTECLNTRPSLPTGVAKIVDPIFISRSY